MVVDLRLISAIIIIKKNKRSFIKLSLKLSLFSKACFQFQHYRWLILFENITVDNRLEFVKHIALIVHKAMSRCRLIFKCFHSRNASIMLKVYVTYVRQCLSSPPYDNKLYSSLGMPTAQ